MAARFMWYELLTTDAPAAEAFYKAVVGWTTDKMGEGPMTYTIFNAGRGGVARHADPRSGRRARRPALDRLHRRRRRRRLRRAGEGQGRHRPHPAARHPRRRPFLPWSTDPQGAAFTLFKGNQPEGPPTGAGERAGLFRLARAGDERPETAFAFYAEVFGWKLDSFDMGPAGPYLLWGVEGGRRPSAA